MGLFMLEPAHSYNTTSHNMHSYGRQYLITYSHYSVLMFVRVQYTCSPYFCKFYGLPFSVKYKYYKYV